PKTNTGTLTIASGALYQVPHYSAVINNISYDYASLYVLNGTLRLDGTATNDSSSNPVEIRVQGPGVVSGTGLVDLLQVEYGGILSPGVNGPGVFHCNNVYP